jgi:hypothetical protein
MGRNRSAFDSALRKARFQLATLLRSAATKDDRCELRCRYQEAHGLMFDTPLSMGARGYELIRQSVVAVPIESSVHVYGRPAAEETRFTHRKILLPAETQLYVVDTYGMWKLVAHPPDRELGGFVGWIRMHGLSYKPGGGGSTVAAIVREHRRIR